MSLRVAVVTEHESSKIERFYSKEIESLCSWHRRHRTVGRACDRVSGNWEPSIKKRLEVKTSVSESSRKKNMLRVDT